jgi:hypothetical protein
MRTRVGATVLAVAAILLSSGAARAQTKPADCPKAEKVDGRITKIDTQQGKLTVQGADGKTYEFTGSKEALQDKKVGDHIEVTRRMPEGCK